MSRSIALSVRHMDQFLRGLGAAVRRLELEGVAYDHSAPELGIAFEPVSIGFADITGKLFQGEIIRELQRNLSIEQATTLCLLGEAAEKTGFEMEQEGHSSLPGPAVNLLLAPRGNFEGMLGASFEDRKALPPASTEFDTFSRLFDKGKHEREAKAVRSKSAH